MKIWKYMLTLFIVSRLPIYVFILSFFFNQAENYRKPSVGLLSPMYQERDGSNQSIFTPTLAYIIVYWQQVGIINSTVQLILNCCSSDRKQENSSKRTEKNQFRQGLGDGQAHFTEAVLLICRLQNTLLLSVT